MASGKKRERPNIGLALDHVELASHGPASYAPFCLFAPGWLTGYDGVVAAGYRIAEQMPGMALHTETLRYAVHRAGTPFSMSIMSDGTLRIKGADFAATIHGTPATEIPNVLPDHPSCGANEDWRNVMRDVAAVTTAREQRIIGAAVLLRRDSVVGTNGTTILEGHHGLGLPGEWLVPREFVDALAKVKYIPSAIGYGADTLTVWFGNNVWLRTNVYAEKYPDTDVLFAQHRADISELRPLPGAALLALETLKPFQDGKVMLDTEGFTTASGARYTFPHHMQGERIVTFDAMRYAATHGKYIGFNSEAFFWYGDRLRGISVAKKDQ